MKRLIAILLLLSGCAAETLTPAQQEFQQACLANNDPFMLMSEMKNGQVIGPSCHGCMPDERNHICSLDEYQRFP